ncbi:DUF2207 domain-containing protein [Lacrimispora sp.]|uniref:DUF2207 domain-containing protein n=1 Tax=Lacrimispora sp. TaxID=2719234 RepID=UPI0028AB0476|nr:DUF2207 domain-containing protein [Lacrimispora sp.]
MKLSKQRFHIFFILLTMLLVLGVSPVYAKEDAIPAIDVEATLQRDGSAVIREVWDVRGVSSGTEYYKALNNMKGMSVHSLMVWDETGTQFKTLDDWNTKLSREEKAGKSGTLKTSDGYELCWGIGSYGDHQYTIQYTIDGLVKNYGDYAGFYHQFISDLSSPPQSVHVTIKMADTGLTEDNARIWGYGFKGEVKIADNGTLTAISSKSLGNNDYVNVLSRFEKELFPQAPKANMTFEALQKSADNDNSNTALYIALSIVAAAIIIIIFLISFFASRYKLADGSTVRLSGMKQIEVNYSIPFGGSIPAVYSTMQLLRRNISFDKLISAYFIRWQEAGYIHMEKQKAEAIVFYPDKTPDSQLERSLYDILSYGTDATGILLISDLEKRGEELYDKLNAWEESVKQEGEEELIRSGAAAAGEKGAVLFTASGFEQAKRILGLQKYLLKMIMQKEDKEADRQLWGDYFVIAALFGIGDKVLKRFKALDPSHFDYFAGRYGCNSYSMFYLMTMTNHISSTASPSSNINGMGGGTSSFGGGGFSGGGGGGSR